MALIFYQFGQTKTSDNAYTWTPHLPIFLQLQKELVKVCNLSHQQLKQNLSQELIFESIQQGKHKVLAC